MCMSPKFNCKVVTAYLKTNFENILLSAYYVVEKTINDIS